jgi:hypothetical protein
MSRLGPERSLLEHGAAASITAAQYALASVARLRSQRELALHDHETRSWLDAIAQHGYLVLPGFFSREHCAQGVAEIERLFREHPSFVQRRSDLRMFGVEAGSALLASFARDARLLRVAERVLGEPTVNAFTLGARIDYSPGNKGAGEGWHRDSFVVQFKAILYLSDVDARQGPFELIEDSQRLPTLVADIVRARLGLAQNRITEQQVARLLDQASQRLRTFTASAGTLLLVNTSAIHRGKPIEHGSRYSLTNYFVQRPRAGAAMDAHFAPVLRSPLQTASAPAQHSARR